MQRLSPDSLTGPRAYFTAFDPLIVARSKSQEQLRRDCERKLKILLLVKSRVVCAASHLVSPVAFQIFRDNPDLLSGGHIAPALRDTKGTISDAFEGPSDIRQFYEDNVACVVSWKLQDNSPWFREQFLGELSDPRSVVRRNAQNISDKQVEKLVTSLAGQSGLNREDTEPWIAGLPAQDAQVVRNYRELVYHVGGARAVWCESSLPQEDYLDYDLADLSQRRTRLSDEMVFWKLFVEEALTTLEMLPIPIETLDTITFQDVLKLRSPLLNGDFQLEYDSLVQTAIQVARSSKANLVEDVERLEKIRSRISLAMRDTLEMELPDFLATKPQVNSMELASNLSSIALGLAGFHAEYGAVASIAGLVKDSIAVLFNLTNLRTTRLTLRDMAEIRELAFSNIAARRPSEETPMFDVVNSLTSAIRQRLTMLP